MRLTDREVIGIGAAGYDILLALDGFPIEDQKQPTRAHAEQGGGPASTALCVMAAMGVSCALMGRMGGDDYAERILEEFRRCGVGTEYIRQTPGAQTVASFVLINRRDSTRTCVWNPGSVPSVAPEELDEDALRHARILHLDGHHLPASIRAAQIAREAGALVSLDIGSPYPGIGDLLPYVDLLMPARDFVRRWTGENDPYVAARALYRRYQPRLLAVTWGAEGGLLIDTNGERRYPAFCAEPVEDTNGAGDVFHGAFLAAWLRGMDVDACARMGSAAAAMKCAHLGVRAHLPTFEQVRRFACGEGNVRG